MNRKDIVQIIEEDEWMMDILRSAESLNLPDWWIGAGFVRGKVWDILHEYKKRTPVPDIDIIYFDKKDFSKIEASKYTTKAEEEYQKILKHKMPAVKWSVTNQARMHLFHKDKPYRNSEEALSNRVETATCIGVKINKNKIILCAPWGIKDLTSLILRPSPAFRNNLKTFYQRVGYKEWIKKWPKLTIRES